MAQNPKGTFRVDNGERLITSGDSLLGEVPGESPVTLTCINKDLDLTLRYTLEASGFAYREVNDVDTIHQDITIPDLTDGPLDIRDLAIIGLAKHALSQLVKKE